MASASEIVPNTIVSAVESTNYNSQSLKIPVPMQNVEKGSSAPVQTTQVRKELHDDEDKRFKLIIRQQPKQARCSGISDRGDRRPVDPLPILQLVTEDSATKSKNFISNPFYFVYATLLHATTSEEINILKNCNSRAITDSIASSLQRLKDIDGFYGGFFVFPDISIRVEGKFRLKFTLFEIVENEVVRRSSVNSDIFTVYNPKTFPGMSESTPLSRHFAEQGLKIRIRKENRVGMRVQIKNSIEKESNNDVDMIKGLKRRKQESNEELKTRGSSANKLKAADDDGRQFNEGFSGMNHSPGNGQWSAPPMQIYQQQFAASSSSSIPHSNIPDYYDPNMNRGQRYVQSMQPDPRYPHSPISEPSYYQQRYVPTPMYPEYPNQQGHAQPGYPQYPQYPQYPRYGYPYNSPLPGSQQDGGYVNNSGEYFKTPNTVKPHSLNPYMRDQYHQQLIGDAQQSLLSQPSSSYNPGYSGQYRTVSTNMTMSEFPADIPQRHSINASYISSPRQYYPDSRPIHDPRTFSSTPIQPAPSTSYYNVSPAELQPPAQQSIGYNLPPPFRQDATQGIYGGQEFQ